MRKDGPGSLGCLSLTQLEFCFHKHYVTAGKDQHICGLDGVTAGGFTPVFPFRCLDALGMLRTYSILCRKSYSRDKRQLGFLVHNTLSAIFI